MEIDLYSADLTRVSASELFQAVESFVRVDQPREQRPAEGYVLDFKQDWGDKALHTLAAFANTFGGLLVVGITESDGRPEVVVGILEKGELKTRLASLIASNLTPVPDFDIAVSRLPDDETRCIAVVRVRQCAEVCMLTKKGERNPVYVRVEDKSEPANASQLRSLIDREKRAGGQDPARTAARINQFNNFYVFRERAQGGGSEASQSFLRVVLSPTDHPRIEIDLSVERRFSDAIVSNFPGLQKLEERGSAVTEWERTRDWTQLALQLSPPLAPSHERRWKFYYTGDIGFVAQTVMTIDSNAYWSLYDLAADLGYLMKAAREFWQTFGYYGKAELSVDLRVENAQVLRHGQSYGALFYNLVGAGFSLDATAVLRRQGRGGNRAEYQAPLSYDSLTSGRAYTVTCALNQLLRSLGLGSDLGKLEQSIRASVIE